MVSCEFAMLWGGAPVPLEVRMEKGAWNHEPAVRSFGPTSNGSVLGRFSEAEIRRLNRMFVQLKAEGRVIPRRDKWVSGWRDSEHYHDHLYRHFARKCGYKYKVRGRPLPVFHNRDYLGRLQAGWQLPAADINILYIGDNKRVDYKELNRMINADLPPWPPTLASIIPIKVLERVRW